MLYAVELRSHFIPNVSYHILRKICNLIEVSHFVAFVVALLERPLVAEIMYCTFI